LPSKAEIKERREGVQLELSKHNYKADAIATELKCPVKAVYNDLQFIRKDSQTWLDEWALDGYALATRTTIEQLQRMEKELTEFIKLTSDPKLKLKAVNELRETINLRWVVQGEGPTLINLRRFVPRETSNQLN